MATYEYRRTFVPSEFQMINSDVKAGTYLKVLEYVVPAQQRITYGAGRIVNGVDDRDTLVLRFKDSGGSTIHGWVRLAVADANEVVKQLIIEKRTEELETGVKLGVQKYWAREDSKLIIEFKPDANATISKIEGRIPATIRYVG